MEKKEKDRIERERFERAIELNKRKALRQHIAAEYFTSFAKPHIPWLKELARRYKSNGEFRLMPCAILPSYYEDPLDKEIAAIAGLLIYDDGYFARIPAFRELLGEHPRKWFDNREFVALSLGPVQNKRVGGVVNWRIARLFDKLWHKLYPDETRRIPRCKTIGELVYRLSFEKHRTMFETLSIICNDCGVRDHPYKLRLFLMIMGTSDGVGIDLWNVNDDELGCPISYSVQKFVASWFPNWRKVGGIDKAISLFGFDRECDFFYAYMGYKELQKRNPDGCRRYATRYASWFANYTITDNSNWKRIQPYIPF